MLNLYVLGRVGLFSNERPVRLSPLCFNLLAYLALHRNERHSRAKLAAVLWPDCGERHARMRLNSALHRLRRGLPRRGGRLFEPTGDGVVGLDPDAPIVVDSERFYSVLHDAFAAAPAELDDAHAGRIEDALRLYRGELLAGLDVEWSLVLRERLRNLYIRGLSRLTDFYADRDMLAKAITLAETAVATEPLREPLQQRLIELYRESGERALALRQYRQLEANIVRELGVAPLAETRALVADLLPPVARAS